MKLFFVISVFRSCRCHNSDRAKKCCASYCYDSLYETQILPQDDDYATIVMALVDSYH